MHVGCDRGAVAQIIVEVFKAPYPMVVQSDLDATAGDPTGANARLAGGLVWIEHAAVKIQGLVLDLAIRQASRPIDEPLRRRGDAEPSAHRAEPVQPGPREAIPIKAGAGRVVLNNA